MTPSSLPATIKITSTAEPDPYATERLAAATLVFTTALSVPMPGAAGTQKAELRARGVRLN